MTRSQEAALYSCARCKVKRQRAEFGNHKGRGGVDGRHPYCKPCVRDKDRSPSARWSHFKTEARIAGHEIRISREQFEAWLKEPCHYCGGPLAETGRGLDRKENEPHYAAENVIPCCAVCNTAKSNKVRYKEMLILGAAYRQIHAIRAAEGLPHLTSYQTGRGAHGSRKAKKKGAAIVG
jgi:hypothetical protein